MSTPIGDPRNPTDAFADGSHETSKRADPKQQDAGRGGDPPRSPYAPARSYERTGGERRSTLKEYDPLRSPYAPQRPSRPPTAAAARHDEIRQDLDRLEASLHAVWHEETVARLPRAAQLPPVAGLAPVGEGYDAAYRAPDALEPEHLVPPQALMSRGDRVRRPLIILAAIAVAAPIVYYAFIAGSNTPRARGPQTASVAPIAVVQPPPADPRPPVRAEADDAGKGALTETPSERGNAPRAARLPETRTMAALAPIETGPRASPPDAATRVLDPEEIKVLVKQGEQFAEAGDLAGARILFQRAAEAGDAAAATALGATYDPTVFTKLRVVGFGADLEKARFWYQKAASLGSPDAKRRLELLANR